MSALKVPKAPKKLTAAQLSHLRMAFRRPNSNRFNPRHFKNLILEPLDAPLRLALADVDKVQRSDVITAIYHYTMRTRTSYAVWSPQQWAKCFRNARSNRKASWRHTCVLAAYRLAGIIIVDQLFEASQQIVTARLCETVFGQVIVRKNIALICDKLISMGYGPRGAVVRVPTAIAEMMLILDQPDVMQWKEPIPKAQLSSRHSRFSSRLHAISIALVGLGVIKDATRFRAAFGFAPHREINYDLAIAPEWLRWADEWLKISTLEPSVRRSYWRRIRHAGRWLFRERPTITSPKQWNTKTAAEFVAAVCKWKVGDYLDPLPKNVKGMVGQELRPNSKHTFLTALRTFFRDLQDLELIPTRFNPATALRTPKSVTAMCSDEPRILADDVWAKLLYAGINLTKEQLPKGMSYPIELVRAVTVN